MEDIKKQAELYAESFRYKIDDAGWYEQKVRDFRQVVSMTANVEYIRNRDAGNPCISCGKYTTLQAGHFYSGGHYSALRFDEDNIHGQCLRCNYYLSGNLNNYRINLEKKIGAEKLAKLDLKADIYKRNRTFKWDKFTLLDTIKYYKEKNKSLKKWK